MIIETAVKRTHNSFKSNVSIPWVKSNIQDVINEIEYPIMLQDLRDVMFTPSVPLDESIYCFPPPGERSMLGNPILKPLSSQDWMYHHPLQAGRPLEILSDAAVPCYPISRDNDQFKIKTKKTLMGIELVLDDAKLNDQAAELLENYEQMNSVGAVPLFRLSGNRGVFIGSIPRKTNRLYRNVYWDGYLTCLLANVTKKISPKEQIVIRKSAIQESNDVDMKLPSHFFKSKAITYHFILEEEDISILLSLKDDVIQIVRVENRLDVRVFNARIEELTDEEGYVTSTTIRRHLDQLLDLLDLEGDSELVERAAEDTRNVDYHLKIEAQMLLEKNEISTTKYQDIVQNSGNNRPKAMDTDGEGYEGFTRQLIDWDVLTEKSQFRPNRPVISELMTPSYPWLYGSSMEIAMIPKGTEEHKKWIEDYVDSIHTSMKLYSTLQDPKSKETMIKLTREYRRGERKGDTTKFKVWGIRANLIRPEKGKMHGYRNRAHYVRGHFRRQPIKNVNRYREEGYEIDGDGDRFFVDKYISEHWRGNSDLGKIETIYYLGDSPRGSFSGKAIRWLQSIAEKRDIIIKHARNGGEQVFALGNGKYIRVDGYCEETNEVFEFYGDYWHGNPEKYEADDVNKSNKKKFGELYIQTQQREEWIDGLGMKLNSIWESDFDSQF